MNGKIVSRKFARQGGLLYTIEVTVKPASADGKTPAEVKEQLCLVSNEQIATMTAVGVKVPAINDTVVVEPSVNPTTGLVNEQWVNISL